MIVVIIRERGKERWNKEKVTETQRHRQTDRRHAAVQTDRQTDRQETNRKNQEFKNRDLNFPRICGVPWFSPFPRFRRRALHGFPYFFLFLVDLNITRPLIPDEISSEHRLM